MNGDINLPGPASTWKEVTPGGTIIGGAGAALFITGDWRTDRPLWNVDACRQCLLCAPACPDSSIPVADGKRTGFDLDHCKGCGICAEVCSFGAITMIKER